MTRTRVLLGFQSELQELRKVARADDERGHAVRNTAMAAGAAAPFAGLIGEQPVLHDPVTNPSIRRFKTVDELAREARPGDVLLTSKPTGSAWKSFIAPTSGSEFYHSEAIAGRSRAGKGKPISAGQYDDPSWRGSTKKDIAREMNPLGRAFAKEYPDIMLMRPKGMTAEQARAFSNEAIARGRQPYDRTKAVGTWLREIFVPKVRGLENAKRPPVCEGNVCSTLPAMAYDRAGIKVIPGKRPQDVFPPDFLRSERFEPVGVRMKSEYKARPALRKAMPYLTRGAIGAALAGGIYGVSKDPALAAAPLGAIGGGLAASALHQHLTGKALPNAFEMMNGLGELKGKARSKLIRGFAGKRLPAMLAGAAASYLGAKALKDRLSRSASPSE